MILPTILEILWGILLECSVIYDFIRHSPYPISHFTTVLIHFTKSFVIV
jgi:hypothetical protein